MIDGTPAKFAILISKKFANNPFLLYSSRYSAAAMPMGKAITVVSPIIHMVPTHAVYMPAFAAYLDGKSNIKFQSILDIPVDNKFIINTSKTIIPKAVQNRPKYLNIESSYS